MIVGAIMDIIRMVDATENLDFTALFFGVLLITIPGGIYIFILHYLMRPKIKEQFN